MYENCDILRDLLRAIDNIRLIKKIRDLPKKLADLVLEL